MVEVLPFQGLRYSPAYTRATVFSPPYDVIDAAQRQRLAAQDPRNVVQVDLRPATAGEDWYAQAAATLQAWLSDGTLLRDPTPCLYGYRQFFHLPGESAPRVRNGFFAGVRLAPWGQGIYRHEFTRVGPRADRLKLMRATQTSLSPVFGMYHDPDGCLAAYLEPPQQPLVDVTDDEGVRHIFWAITAPDVLAAITAAMSTRDIVIADGHHRYETALAYRDERRAAEGDPPATQPYDQVLMYLAAVEDPGLEILPTHRVIHGDGPLDAAALLGALAADFEVAPAPAGISLTAAIARAARESDTIAIGACLGPDARYVLRLRSRERARQAAGAQVAAELADLDVVVLQSMVLAPHLGITAEVLAHGERVWYTIDEAAACADVAADRAQAAFILNPTALEQVWQSASRGVTMPQKSTYFYPKLLTGLVFWPLY